MNSVRRSRTWSRTSRRKITSTFDQRMGGFEGALELMMESLNGLIRNPGMRSEVLRSASDPIVPRGRTRRGRLLARSARPVRPGRRTAPPGSAGRTARAARRARPSAWTRPLWMIATREQSFSTSCIEWVEKTIVLPWSRSSAIFWRTARATRTSSPEVGSSKISTGGSWTIVRAIETFCLIPVDIFEPRTSRKSFIWSQSKIVSIRSRSRSGASP